MEKEVKEVIGLFARYFLIILLGLGNLYLFYKILTPLTIWSVFGVLSLFSNQVQIIDNWIFYNLITISIIPACVAGAAFYLMFILIFSTKDIKVINRAKILISSFLLLFLFNILRIIFLIFLFGSNYFDVLHWLFWNILSTVAVVGIWILMVRLFRINKIPIYSDILYLKSLSSKKDQKFIRLENKGKKSKRGRKN